MHKKCFLKIKKHSRIKNIKKHVLLKTKKHKTFLQLWPPVAIAACIVVASSRLVFATSSSLECSVWMQKQMCCHSHNWRTLNRENIADVRTVSVLEQHVRTVSALSVLPTHSLRNRRTLCVLSP